MIGNQSIPTFPQNTDGIDSSGTNITMRNLIITSYDDDVAVKSAHQGNLIAKCTENMLIENVVVYQSTGMAIGSVAPHELHACVRNITFRNITFIDPIKGVYVKTNPGSSGDGIIENIIYEDIRIEKPKWWGIYIGPRHDTGLGCLLYPFYKTCET